MSKLTIGNVSLDNNVILAPMAGVTDLPFRLLCREQGAGLICMEMVSAKAILYNNKNTEDLMAIHPQEKPVSLQLFGSEPDILSEMAKRIEEKPFDILDLNMGCPVPKVVNNGEGSALMKNPRLVEQILTGLVKAVQKPVTVKTRLGYDSEHKEIVDIAERLQDVGIQALTIHGRLRTTKWGEPADWTLIGEVKNNPRMTIPIIGNGDVVDGPSAKYFLDNFGVDGLMIGRATYGNPWIFREVKHYLSTGEILPSPTVEERVRVAKAHLVDSLDYKKDEFYAVMEMRKHWGLYFKGFINFKQFKMRLMEVRTVEEVFTILDEVVNYYNSVG